MSKSSLFEPIVSLGASADASIDVTFNGEKLRVPGAANVAAALLAAGVRRFRNSPVSGAGRAPYCMMGVCFECLLEIDGVPNRQSCLTPIRPGMVINTQDNLPEHTGDVSAPALALAAALEGSHGRH